MCIRDRTIADFPAAPHSSNNDTTRRNSHIQQFRQDSVIFIGQFVPRLYGQCGFTWSINLRDDAMLIYKNRLKSISLTFFSRKTGVLVLSPGWSFFSMKSYEAEIWHAAWL